MDSGPVNPDARPRRWITEAGKWVAGITAILTLLLGLQQLGSWILERAERSREADALIAVARQQASRQEFAQAWQSLDAAADHRDDEALLDARVEVAFAWLQEARPGPGNPFSVITDAVTPALDRALLTAEGSRRADVLAHLGWATFLRRRDTGTGDPAPRYEEALAIDPGNAYANAMLGHWLLWQKRPIEEGLARFQAALASGRARAFVRQLTIAALVNWNNEEADLELLRVADDMRKATEPLDSRTADRFFDAFTMVYRRGAAVPAANLRIDDMTATYEYVVKASPKAQGSAQLDLIRSELRDGAADAGP